MELNREQRRAVESDRPRILVIAGAGSGKTRVLKDRAARLLRSGVPPASILAITFTNKAAGEMLERLRREFQDSPHWFDPSRGGMIVSTFHSLAARVIRKFASVVNRTEHFSIYDEQDRRDILAAIGEELGLKIKDPDKLLENDTVKRLYEESLARSNALDFDGLEASFLRILKESPEALAYYRQTWKYVMVDEYQDTSFLQATILGELFPEHLFVVGDPRQAIYGFRGATVENILGMARDAEFEVIELTRNYRSGGRIVDAANALIAHNTEQFAPQESATEYPGAVEEISAADEPAAALAIARRVWSLTRDARPQDVAILARTWRTLSHVARVMTDAGMPCRCLKEQTPLWDREEVRLLVRLMKVAANPGDDQMLALVLRSNAWRVAGGDGVLDADGIRKARVRAVAEEVPLLEAVGGRIAQAIAGAREGAGMQDLSRIPAADLAHDIEEALELRMTLQSRNLASRVESLVKALEEIEAWELDEKNDDLSASAFLTYLTARQLQDAIRQDEDKTLLMTVHAAKGLEWRHVIVAGMEEGRFPLKSESRGDELEESRRLAYVAITRAREAVILVHSETAEQPWSGHQIEMLQPSRFIAEALGKEAAVV